MRLLLGLEGVLDELLGDRRGALRGAVAEDVLDQGAADALEVDAAVLVEARVLDRDHGVLDVGGDLPELSRILFWLLVSVPIGSPEASRTSLFFEALYWAKL